VENEPTVFIIDDDPAVRQALSVLVRSMNLHVESLESADQYLQAVDPNRPGCLLVDVRMPGTSGLELLERLQQSEARLPVIVMSAYGDVPMVVRAMKSGALNFLEKPCRDQQLWEAIQEGLRWDTAHRRRLALRAKALHRLSKLTEGECEVLRLLTRGQSNKTIAAQLGLSVRTIEVRRSKIMRKMKADSLAELVQLTLAAEADWESPRPLPAPTA